MRKVNFLQIVTFGLQRAAGPYRRAKSSQTVNATFIEGLSAVANQKQAALRVLPVATEPPAQRAAVGLV